MRQLLWWLVGGSRGGRNRLRIVRALQEQPRNTNQLSNDLDLNYKTVEHHLKILVENDVLTTRGANYGQLYFLTEKMKRNTDVLEEVAEQADLEPDDS